jgi:hypothetical protein
MRLRINPACLFFLLAATVAYGATFVVPTDRDMVRRAQAIVIGQALASYTQRTAWGGIETVTPFSVEEVIKGRIASGSITIYEPGGVSNDIGVVIPGVPRFEEGERVVLFLGRTGFDRWSVTDIALGKFTFATDRSGRKVAVRAENDIVGWNPDGSQYHEMRRSADGFLAFLRTEAAGGKGTLDYLVPSEPLQPTKSATPQGRAAALAFTANSYTSDFGSGIGGRWNSFPQPFYTDPGTSGAALTAVTAGLGVWTGYAGAAITYSNGGADPCSGGCRTGGLVTSDGLNTVLWEQDLVTNFGISPFTCTSSSYGGVLGIGGPWVSGSHSGPNGETFLTTIEGDVMMNKGVLPCLSPVSPFPQVDLNSAVAHELGHTLGFRHSDQTRADDPSIACSTDVTLECSTHAIMTAFVTSGLNAALQAWDQHAAAAVYPSSVGPTPPTGVIATASSATSVGVSWNASAGATSYQVYRKAVASGAATLVCSPAAPTVSCTDSTALANTAYVYYVVTLIGGTASANSLYDLATTVMYTDDPITVRTTPVKMVHVTDLRTAVNAVRTLAGLGAATWTNSVVAGSTIRAADVTDLRTNLDVAMAILGLRIGGYTDASLTGVVVKAVHLAEIRTRMK